jgi:hypothetical protein
MRLLLALLFFFHPAQQTVFLCTGSGAYAYHFKSGCTGLKHCKSETISVTLEKARAMERQACQLCAGSAVIPAKSSGGAANDGQCSATTKKGSRCSRGARSGGHCWQHGG